jgi:hypothetical protein
MTILYLILKALTISIIMRGFQSKDWLYVIVAFICLALEFALEYLPH